MYKIYFNHRKINLSNQEANNTYNCQNLQELTQHLHHFNQNTDIEELTLYHPNLEVLLENLKIHFTYLEAAGGAVFNSQNQLLIIHRLGKWDLPKGKINKKESPETTAIREVQEECGITNLIIQKHLTNTYHTYTIDDKPILKKTHWYIINHTGKQSLTPQAEENITKAIWLPLNQLHTITNNTYLTILDVLKQL